MPFHAKQNEGPEITHSVEVQGRLLYDYAFRVCAGNERCLGAATRILRRIGYRDMTPLLSVGDRGSESFEAQEFGEVDSRLAAGGGGKEVPDIEGQMWLLEDARAESCFEEESVNVSGSSGAGQREDEFSVELGSREPEDAHLIYHLLLQSMLDEMGPTKWRRVAALRNIVAGAGTLLDLCPAEGPRAVRILSYLVTISPSEGMASDWYVSGSDVGKALRQACGEAASHGGK